MQKSNETRIVIPASGSVVTAFNQDVYRKCWTFYNNVNTEAYIAIGSGAALDNFSFITPVSGYYESPMGFFNGAVTVIWPSGAIGSGMFTEIK